MVTGARIWLLGLTFSRLEEAIAETGGGASGANETSVGACEIPTAESNAKPDTRAADGFHDLELPGRRLLSRISETRFETSEMRPSAACAKAKLRWIKLRSARWARHSAYARGLETSAITASSHAISRSRASFFSIHHTAG